MKFSLKHLIVFVAIAAFVCGVSSYANKRIQLAERMAEEKIQIALRQAEQTAQGSLKAYSRLESERRSRQKLRAELEKMLDVLQKSRFAQSETFIYSDGGLDLKRKPKSGIVEHTILHWNLESGGNDPDTIAKQLVELGRYEIIGLSEVNRCDAFWMAIEKNWPLRYRFVVGKSGGSDPLMLVYDQRRFTLDETFDIEEVNGKQLNDGNHRAPLYVRFRSNLDFLEFGVVLNHFARGDEELRQRQAEGLREWARGRSEPIIAIGNYNFDFEFHTQQGNASFDAFLKDDVWNWIPPDPMVDSNWADDGNGKDKYPDSLFDFNFVAGAAKDWKSQCRVIVREGDFPDDEKTSDHRPVELILSRKIGSREERRKRLDDWKRARKKRRNAE